MKTKPSRRSVILGSILLLAGCDDSPKISEEMLAPEPNYPAALGYLDNQNHYIGAPELELKDTGIKDTKREQVDAPISTFDQAFSAAYELLCERYKKESIDSQLPLLIDHKDGIWIIDGAFPRSDKPNTIIMGGTAHLAIEAETGRIIYLWHSL